MNFFEFTEFANNYVESVGKVVIGEMPYVYNYQVNGASTGTLWSLPTNQIFIGIGIFSVLTPANSVLGIGNSLDAGGRVARIRNCQTTKWVPFVMSSLTLTTSTTDDVDFQFIGLIITFK